MNRFRSRKPYYNDDSDYTTNAPSYYDDLARKNEMIKILAERIYNFDETLSSELSKINEVLDEMIFKIGEGFNNEIEILLREWVDDGTLDHIINDVLLKEINNKVDNFIIKINDDLNNHMLRVNDRIEDLKTFYNKEHDQIGLTTFYRESE